MRPRLTLARRGVFVNPHQRFRRADASRLRILTTVESCHTLSATNENARAHRFAARQRCPKLSSVVCARAALRKRFDSRFLAGLITT